MLPGWVVSYPVTWALPVAVVLVILLASALVVGKRRHHLTVTGVLVGIALTVLSLVLSIAASVVATKLQAPDVHFARNPYGLGWRLVFLSALTLAVVAAVFLGADRLLKKPQRVTAIGAGPLVVLATLTLLTAATAPSLSYVFTWPTAAGTALLSWRVLKPEQAVRTWPLTGALVAVALVVALAMVPLVYLLAGAASLIQPTFVGVIVLLIALQGGVLVPHFRHLTGRRTWAVPVTLLLMSAIFVAGEQTSRSFGPDRPRPDYIQYTLDADTGQATWLSAGIEPDRWTRQFFTDGYTRDRVAFSPGYFFDQKFDVITAPAPSLALRAPRLKVLSDNTVDGVRTVSVRVISPRGAPMAHLDLQLPGDLLAVRVDGKDLAVDEAKGLRRLPIAAYNLGDQGIDVSLSIRSTDPITGTLADFSNGLPELGARQSRNAAESTCRLRSTSATPRSSAPASRYDVGGAASMPVQTTNRPRRPDRALGSSAWIFCPTWWAEKSASLTLSGRLDSFSFANCPQRRDFLL